MLHLSVEMECWCQNAVQLARFREFFLYAQIEDFDALLWPSVCHSQASSMSASVVTLMGSEDFHHVINAICHVINECRQYIKVAEHLVYGAPEWTHAPRLPLIGQEREAVVRTVTTAVNALRSRKR
jgi:hypothetical protein